MNGCAVLTKTPGSWLLFFRVFLRIYSNFYLRSIYSQLTQCVPLPALFPLCFKLYIVCFIFIQRNIFVLSVMSELLRTGLPHWMTHSTSQMFLMQDGWSYSFSRVIVCARVYAIDKHSNSKKQNDICLVVDKGHDHLRVVQLQHNLAKYHQQNKNFDLVDAWYGRISYSNNVIGSIEFFYSVLYGSNIARLSNAPVYPVLILYIFMKCRHGALCLLDTYIASLVG